MKRTITICTCDICGKEKAKEYKTITYRTFDSTDGKTYYDPPRIEQETLDLCDECAIKATNIHSVGVQCGEYKLEHKKGETDAKNRLRRV